MHAEVLRVLSEEQMEIPGTGVKVTVQLLEARAGDLIFTLENDRIPLAVGDSFYASYDDEFAERFYTIIEIDRRNMLILAACVFVFMTVLIGGWVGVRAIIALAVSVLFIVFFLLPELAGGVSPLLMSVVSAAFILAVAMSITHGVNRTTAVAFSASIVSIVVAIFFGGFFVDAARLSGFTDDTSAILNLATGGSLRMEGLLLGALIIGALGIIDDLAMTQVLTVKELGAANPALSRRELYERAMVVGRGHLGAVVNTLVLAYVGASLPLLLLFTISPAPPLYLLNSEIMAVEIFRALLGGVTLTLVLPAATFLATSIFSSKRKVQ